MVLIAPFVLLLAATLIAQLTGFRGPYQLFATSPAAIVVATISLFIGLPVAFVLKRVAHHAPWTAPAGRLVEGLLALENRTPQLAVVLLSLLVAAFFVGTWPSILRLRQGVHSAC